MKSVKIIGAGGYGGVGMVELLLNHPEFELNCLVAKTETGMKISELYPHLNGFCDLPILDPDAPDAQGSFDAVFFSTPDRVGMQTAADELAIDFLKLRSRNLPDKELPARSRKPGPRRGHRRCLRGGGPVVSSPRRLRRRAPVGPVRRSQLR